MSAPGREPQPPARRAAGRAERGPLARTLRSLARIALVVFVGFSGLLYLLQDQLVFPGAGLSQDARRHLLERVPGTTELHVEAGDGTLLHGWLRRFAPGEGPAPLAIYFGGNAEDVARAVASAEGLAPWTLAAFAYRGYGASEGSPSEAALFADALAIHDTLASRADVDASRIASVGRSLGSGVAVHLAASRPLAAVALVTPYDSVTALAQASYPWVPVRMLLRHPFDSLSRAGSVTVPALFLVAGADTIIPPQHARRLYERWAGPKDWVLARGATHNAISADPGYWPTIADFLGVNRSP